MRLVKVITGLSVFLFFMVGTSFSEDEDVQETIRQMQERIENLEKKDLGIQVIQGLEMGVGGTVIVQGVNNVNHNGGCFSFCGWTSHSFG